MSYFYSTLTSLELKVLPSRYDSDVIPARYEIPLSNKGNHFIKVWVIAINYKLALITLAGHSLKKNCIYGQKVIYC